MRVLPDLLAPGARLEKLATGCGWAEGPVWIPETGRLRWSDVTRDRILEWDAGTGATSEYAVGVEFTNGRTRDLEGRVVQCSHGLRRVERVEPDGAVIPLVESWEGGRFNSPNDVVVASDGAVWFTDPPYGILPAGLEGHPGESDYGGCHVFRVEPATGIARAVVTDMVRPNGLAFSPDESLLYVADTAGLDIEGAPAGVRVYRVEGGACRDGRDLFAARPGATDGLRVDVEGRIWSSSASGVQVFDADGARLLEIPVPETVANLCFGGDDGTELFVTATTSLYRIRTTTTDSAARERIGG